MELHYSYELNTKNGGPTSGPDQRKRVRRRVRLGWTVGPTRDLVVTLKGPRPSGRKNGKVLWVRNSYMYVERET